MSYVFVTFYFFLSFRKYIKIPWITLPRHAPITAPAMVIPSISTYRNLFAENAHTHATTQHKTINPIQISFILLFSLELPDDIVSFPTSSSMLMSSSFDRRINCSGFGAVSPNSHASCQWGTKNNFTNPPISSTIPQYNENPPFSPPKHHPLNRKSSRPHSDCPLLCFYYPSGSNFQ